jgi:nucleotide-binding universal stress UspA family protein
VLARGLLGRVCLGNDTLAALNGAPCAVAIAQMGYAATAHHLSSIGVGYDGSPESEHALAAARELAGRHGSTIKALSVVSVQNIPYGDPIAEDWPDVAKHLMHDELRRLRSLEDVEGDVSYGEPSEELAQFSEDLDLLIVGSRSYGSLGRLMNGSTSNYLADRGRCSLVVLPRSAAKK